MIYYLTWLLALIVLAGCNPISYWRTQQGPSEAFYREGKLAPCPPKPNCVSTQATIREHVIVPYTFSKTLPEVKLALRHQLREMAETDRVKLVKEDGAYLHVEFRSKVFHMVDDVEIIFDEASRTLQFRSGSRFGFTDWSTNRRRMEDLRNALLGKI